MYISSKEEAPASPTDTARRVLSEAPEFFTTLFPSVPNIPNSQIFSIPQGRVLLVFYAVVLSLLQIEKHSFNYTLRRKVS